MRLVDVYVNNQQHASVHALATVTAESLGSDVYRAIVRSPADFVTYVPLVVRITDGGDVMSASYVTRSITDRAIIEELGDEYKAIYQTLETKLRDYAAAKSQLDAAKQKNDVFTKLSENVTDPRFLNVHHRGGPSPNPGAQVTANLSKFVDEATQRIAEDAEANIDLGLKLATLRDEIQCLEDDLKQVLPPYTCPCFNRDDPLQSLYNFRRHFQGPRIRQVQDIVVQFRSESPRTEVELDLQFVVNGCSWSPSYDLSFDDSGKCKVKYNATVTQNSRINWDHEDCRIYLTTSSFVAAEAPSNPTRKTVDIKKPPAPAPQMRSCLMRADMDLGVACCYAECATMEQRSLAGTNIQLKAGTVLPHKGESPTTVAIGEFELDAKLFYHLPTDSRKSAYRVFCMKNTSSWTIMPSNNVAIWFASHFIGKVSLKDHYPPGAELNVYGGVDDAVSVSSLKTGLFKSNSGNFLTGSSKKETMVNAFEVFNSHNDLAIDLLVTYDLPVSSNHLIKVVPQTSPIPNGPACPKNLPVCNHASDPMAVFLAGAQPETWIHNETTGNVISIRRVQPQSKTTTGFSYSIERPVDKEIHREVSTVA